MLYPVLHRLEGQGLIAATWTDSPAGRQRRYYALTRDGRKALREQRAQWNAVHQTLAMLWGG
jgi:DNA-binding PadR family transcriptional regulator